MPLPYCQALVLFQRSTEIVGNFNLSPGLFSFTVGSSSVSTGFHAFFPPSFLLSPLQLLCLAEWACDTCISKLLSHSVCGHWSSRSCLGGLFFFWGGVFFGRDKVARAPSTFVALDSSASVSHAHPAQVTTLLVLLPVTVWAFLGVLIVFFNAT